MPLRYITFFFCCLLYIGLRFLLHMVHPLDGDEIFSFLTARAPWPQFQDEVVRDAIHPPLFYLLLRGWIKIGGQTLAHVRLLPTLFSMACLAPLILLARHWRLDVRAVTVATFLLAVNPAVLYYAVHLRMYSLLMLLSLTALWLLARVLDDGRRWIWALSAVNLAMVYTHYYGWVVVALEALAVLAWRKDAFARFAIFTGVVAALFAPWAYVAARALAAKGGLGENIGWVTRPGWVDLAWYYVELLGLTQVPYAGHAALAVLAALVMAVALNAIPRGFFFGLFAFAPAALVFTASQVLPESIWGQRHLVISIVPFYLLGGLAIWRLPHRYLSLAVSLLVCVWAAYAFVTVPRPAKLQWQDAVGWMCIHERDATDRIPIYVLDDYTTYPLGFHLQMLREDRLSMMAIPSDSLWLPDPRLGPLFDLVPDATPADVSGRAWAAYSHPIADPDPGYLLTLTDRGCRFAHEFTIHDRYREVTFVQVTCGLGNRSQYGD